MASAFPSATTSDEATGTSTGAYTSPGRQQSHLSAAKAWAEIQTTGAIAAGYNVAASTGVATGTVTVNFSTAFSSVNFCVVATHEFTGSNTAATTLNTTIDSTPGGSSVVVKTVRLSDFANSNPNYWHVICFGAQ